MAKVRVAGPNIYSAQLSQVYNKFVLARDAQIMLGLSWKPWLSIL